MTKSPKIYLFAIAIAVHASSLSWAYSREALPLKTSTYQPVNRDAKNMSREEFQSYLTWAEKILREASPTETLEQLSEKIGKIPEGILREALARGYVTEHDVNKFQDLMAVIEINPLTVKFDLVEQLPKTQVASHPIVWIAFTGIFVLAALQRLGIVSGGEQMAYSYNHEIIDKTYSHVVEGCMIVEGRQTHLRSYIPFKKVVYDDSRTIRASEDREAYYSDGFDPDQYILIESVDTSCTDAN